MRWPCIIIVAVTFRFGCIFFDHVAKNLNEDLRKQEDVNSEAPNEIELESLAGGDSNDS